MVKILLASRPHADQLVNTVRLMLDTGLPSFKGEGTIKTIEKRIRVGIEREERCDLDDMHREGHP